MKWKKRVKAHGYLNAIVLHGNDFKNLQAASYHNIKDARDRKQKFYTFIEKEFPLVKYVNWYNCITKKFSHRVYKKDFFN